MRRRFRSVTTWFPSCFDIRSLLIQSDELSVFDVVDGPVFFGLSVIDIALVSRIQLLNQECLPLDQLVPKATPLVVVELLAVESNLHVSPFCERTTATPVLDVNQAQHHVRRNAELCEPTRPPLHQLLGALNWLLQRVVPRWKLKLTRLD